MEYTRYRLLWYVLHHTYSDMLACIVVYVLIERILMRCCNIGERSCFLWTLKPTPTEYKWEEGNLTLMMMVKPTGITIGGG